MKQRETNEYLKAKYINLQAFFTTRLDTFEIKEHAKKVQEICNVSEIFRHAEWFFILDGVGEGQMGHQ